MPTGELFMTVLYARHNPPIWVDIEKSLQKYPFINYQIFMSFEDYKASPQWGKTEILGVHERDWAEIDEVIMHNPIKWVHCFTTNVRPYIDSIQLRLKSIPFTNSKGASDDDIAEYCMAMIFYFSKKFRKLESDKQAKNWDKFRIPTIRGQTLVIFGYGNIGKAIGKAGKYFGMRVIGVKKNVTEQDGVADEIITVERLHEVIPHADYLVLALPSHASTEDVISEREIFLLKKTAVLINVGRGNCIDEVALANALNEDRIGGAALDVFKVEPLPNDNPLWEAKNLIITPHNSWYTEDAYEIASKLFEVATNQFLSNTQFTAIVDLDRGY